MKVTSSVAALPPLMEVLGGIFAAGLLWYASRAIGTGQMTAGEFTAFLAALFLSYGPIKNLVELMRVYSRQSRQLSEFLSCLINTAKHVID